MADARFLAFYLEPLPAALTYQREFSDSDQLRILYDMAQALRHLHSKGYMHQDVRPSNIHYARSRGAVLNNFSTADSLDATATLRGKLRYTPPEFYSVARKSRSQGRCLGTRGGDAGRDGKN